LLDCLDKKFAGDGGDVDSITLPLVDGSGKECDKTFRFSDDNDWLRKELHLDLQGMITKACTPRVREDPANVLRKIREEIGTIKTDLLEKEILSEKQIAKGLKSEKTCQKKD